MVVAYQMAPLTYRLAKHLVDLPYFSLPNLLAKSSLVPEYIQGDAQPEKLKNAVLMMLSQPEKNKIVQETFLKIHQDLRRNADVCASKAIIQLLK
jgi:lipid-A-disaccharide synthase